VSGEPGCISTGTGWCGHCFHQPGLSAGSRTIRPPKPQRTPHIPLPLPGPRAHDLPQRPLGHRLHPIHRFEPQDLLLNNRCQQAKPEQLADPRPRQPEPPRRGGRVRHVAPVDGALDVVGEGQHPRDLRRPPHRFGRGAAGAMAEPQRWKDPDLDDWCSPLLHARDGASAKRCRGT